MYQTLEEKLVMLDEEDEDEDNLVFSLLTTDMDRRGERWWHTHPLNKIMSASRSVCWSNRDGR